jgi:hypothetical protein
MPIWYASTEPARFRAATKSLRARRGPGRSRPRPRVRTARRLRQRDARSVSPWCRARHTAIPPDSSANMCSAAARAPCDRDLSSSYKTVRPQTSGPARTRRGRAVRPSERPSVACARRTASPAITARARSPAELPSSAKGASGSPRSSPVPCDSGLHGLPNSRTTRSLVLLLAPACMGESFQSRVSFGLARNVATLSSRKPARSTSSRTARIFDAMQRLDVVGPRPFLRAARVTISPGRADSVPRAELERSPARPAVVWPERLPPSEGRS